MSKELDYLCNLDQDPDGYWVAYDLKLSREWADIITHYHYYGLMIGNYHDSLAGDISLSRLTDIGHSKSGYDYSSTIGRTLGMGSRAGQAQQYRSHSNVYI